MKFKNEGYTVCEPRYIGSLMPRTDLPCVYPLTVSPPGWFLCDIAKDGSHKAWRMDRMGELPDDEPIKIAFTKYEKEQIEKTGRKDWWNYERL